MKWYKINDTSVILPSINKYILVTDEYNNYSVITVGKLLEEIRWKSCRWKYWLEIPKLHKT